MQLILVPTRFELGFLPALSFLEEGDVVELCGLGPVVAAARTAHLLSHNTFEQVWLVGIAGAGGLLIGQAQEFKRVACYGVGVGDSSDFMTTDQLGWKVWEGPLAKGESPVGASDTGLVLGDTIDLAGKTSEGSDRCLLTVCAAAAHSHDVQHRRQHFPMATAEDMEAYGVAVACAMAGVRLRVVRGISNLAGDRDKTLWQVAEAMEAATEQLQNLYEGDRS